MEDLNIEDDDSTKIVNKSLYERRIEKSIDYSTTVSLSKLEEMILVSAFILFFVSVFLIIMTDFSLISVLLCIASIMFIFILVVYLVLKPSNRKERKQNEEITKVSIDYTYNGLTDKEENNSFTEISRGTDSDFNE